MAIKRLNSKVISSGEYKVILSPDVVSDIFSSILPFFYADSVQKDKSIFKDKLNKKIASDKITLIEDPNNEKLCGKRLFDDEAVNTIYKEIIKDGILKMYLYNLKSSKKDKTQSTGNGYISDIETGVRNMYVKPSNISFDNLIRDMKYGLYINRVTGTHAGINPNNGNISLQSMGYIIEDGKITDALQPFIMTTDFKTLLKNIEDVGNDLTFNSEQFGSPSIKISKVNISS